MFSKSQGFDSINRSTKFVDSQLSDPIYYKTYIHNVDKSCQVSDIPNRYKDKDRVIKERPSMNSFRIYDNNLKKHTNPSEMFMEEYKKQMVQEKIMNSINYINNIKSSNLIQPSWKVTNPNCVYKDNLLDAYEAQVNLLKEESEAQLKLNNSHISNGAKAENNIDNSNNLFEKNVETQFLRNENGVIQVLKHVTTQNKPEYMTMEQLTKEREENAKKLIELEKKYKDAKTKEKYEEMKEKEKMNKKFNYKPEILDELKEILKNENKIFHFDKKKKVKRAKSVNSINVNNSNIPKTNLNKTQEKYVKKYAKYKVKQKMNKIENDLEKMNNKPWNYTKIKSKNVNGLVDRNDDLPGYFGKVDLSLYYYDITDKKQIYPEKFKAPHWSSVTRKDLQNNKINLSDGNIRNNNINYSSISINKEKSKSKSKNKSNKVSPKKNDKSNMKNINELAEKLTREIFEKFEQDFIAGLVTKSQISTEFEFSPDDLIELKYESLDDFLNTINNFPTDLFNRFNFDELKKCILSKYNNQNQNINVSINNNQINSIKIKEDNSRNTSPPKISENINISLDKSNSLKKIKDNDTSKKEEEETTNNYYNEEYDNEEDSIDYDDYLPVYNTKNILIKYDETEKRLEATNQLLYKLEGPPPEKKEVLEDEIKINLKDDEIKPNELTYNDYKTVINKFSNKDDINFTIPKPFDFQEDTKAKIKDTKKLQQFLIDRKLKEDKIINDNYKANKLKTEMFIGNINNFIEADKKEKQRRVEKNMEKLEAKMCPFSFVEKDEKKLKKKREEQLKYESTKEKYPKFKANSIKPSSRGGLNAEDRAKKSEKKREKVIKEKAKKLYDESKMPPMLETHEKMQKARKDRKKADEIKKEKEEQREKNRKKKIFVPNYEKIREREDKKLNDKKNAVPKTIVEPFNFNDNKKKTNMYEKYVENQGKLNAPLSFKGNIANFVNQMNKINE